MAYIGNIPAEAYISISSQTFTTINGTGYTLSSSVTTSEDIALFLNNVRQKPSTYTASGTVLTMGTATTTADELYCVYLGKGIQTVNPPASSVGTSQIADLAVTTAKLDNLAVTNAKIATDAVETAEIKDLNVTAGKLAATQDLSTKTITLPASVSGLGTGITNAQLAGSIDVTSKITGLVPTANLGSGTASASTYLSGNQTYQTISEYDDDAIRNDIATLALHQATNSNSAKYNLVNTNVDQYEDSTGIASFTDCSRDSSGEYVATDLGGTITVALTTVESSTWTVPSGVTSVNVLVVAGGGGGCPSDSSVESGGGAGGGGVVHNSSLTVTPGASISYTVGDGGAGSDSATRDAPNGDNSVFGSITALGGGGTVVNSSKTGGSGGGGSKTGSGSAATQGDSGGGTGYGNAGGDGGAGATCSGGGGGAGSAGSAGSGTTGGAGGAGREFTDFSSYGVSGFFAGGGGGGGTGGAGAAGSGGGGIGVTSGGNGGHGVANTGGGGGGSGGDDGNGGSGGSGVILILYTATASATGNYVSTATTALSAVTTMGAVITYTNASGTNTLNTDIILEVSANAGSNYTTATLSAGGTFATGILQAIANDIVVTSGTSIQYRVSFANQDTKTARINGLSLQY